MDYRIFPPEGFMEATVRVSMSKSITARALTIAALTSGPLLPEQISTCADSLVLAKALGLEVDAQGVPSGSITLPGQGQTINIGGAGTAMRFLTALLAATQGTDAILDGDERMRLRPISPLVDALRTLGADIEYAASEGFAPLHIKGRRLKGGTIEMRPDVSSQFISALLMIAPLMEQGLRIEMRTDPVSRPYILMTLAMMERAGIETDYQGYTISVPPATYRPFAQPAESDWSAASVWYAIEALAAGEIGINELSTDSLQGDRRVAEVFARLGVATECPGEEADVTLSVTPDQDARIDLDCSDIPDLVPAIAVTCAMLGTPFHLTGLATLRVKECDRVQALITELAKVGVQAESDGSDLRWDSRRRPILELPEFDTHGDHRMAMALTAAAVYIPGIVIRQAEVTQKSYPEFWQQLSEAGFTLADPSEPMPQPVEE